jgi:methylase of polypeptide subunit release factors
MPRTARKPRAEWPTCYADPIRGQAFFDGTFIETDSINDPRADRVLPILVEEQILMSRLMRLRLRQLLRGRRSDLRVLDVGTGSGVFAIVAAQEGCTVVAIDSSARACQFARANIGRQAKIGLAEDETQLGPGKILVRHERFEDLVARGAGEFDVVVLSPPYNPTFPGLAGRVATHASAGELGQDVYEAQIRLVPRVLAQDGVCIGNHMTTISGSAVKGEEMKLSAIFPRLIREGRLTMAAPLEELFGPHNLLVMPILPEVFGVARFLARQYERMRASADAPPGLDDYLSSVGKGAAYFALVYFEVRRHGVSESACAELPWPSGDSLPVHGMRWEDRAWLHAMIVENTAPPCLTPLPVFMSHMEAQGGMGDEPAKDIRRRDQKAIFDLLDKAMQILPYGKYFSVIFIDTAPVYPDPEQLGLSVMPQMCRVWFRGKASVRSDYEPGIRLRTALLAGWLKTTRALQRSRTGPFSHPAFTGEARFRGVPGKRYWPFVVETTIPPPDVRAESPVEQVARQALADEIGLPPGQWDPEIHLLMQKDGVYGRGGFCSKDGIAASLLEQLQAAPFGASAEALQTRLKAAGELGDAGPRPQASDDWPEGEDLVACQMAMHRAINAEFAHTMSAIGAPHATQTSVLFGLPIASLYVEPDPETPLPPGYLPRDYAGGAWIYFGIEGETSPAHEFYARELAQLVWTLHSAMYGQLARESQISQTQKRTEAAIYHELPKYIGGLSYRISRHNDQLEAARRQLASLPGAPDLPPTLGTPDELAVIAMYALARGDKVLKEMPRDLADKLAGGLTAENVREMVDRVAWPASREWLLQSWHAVPDCPGTAHVRQQVEQSVNGREFCEISVEVEAALGTPSPLERSGLYPSLLIATEFLLRLAVLHRCSSAAGALSSGEATAVRLMVRDSRREVGLVLDAFPAIDEVRFDDLLKGLRDELEPFLATKAVWDVDLSKLRTPTSAQLRITPPRS